MTLRPGEAPGRAIAVFPFLKTTDPIRLGNFFFRSTDDTSDLETEDAANVREVAEMLFLKDDLRVRSASYAVLSPLDIDKKDHPDVLELERIQAIIAYCYGAPRHTFGDIFFHIEQASLAIFSPQPVTTFLLRPDHHVSPAAELPALQADEWHRVRGYEGRYKEQRNFELQKATPAEVPGTLAGLLKEFFTQHGEKSLALKTLQRYREMADYLDTDLLAMEIPKIKPLHLSREWNRLLTSGGKGRKQGKPLSRKTVRNIAGLVSSAYTRGLRWGIAEINPVPASEPPCRRRRRAWRSPLSSRKR